MAWLKVYEKDDLQKLCSELLNVTALALFGNGEWSELDAVVHEWRESAHLAQSSVLDAAMNAEELDETPLPSPDEVLRCLEG